MAFCNIYIFRSDDAVGLLTACETSVRTFLESQFTVPTVKGAS